MSKPSPLLPVAEALERITAALAPLPSESVGLAHALGRVLAEDVVSRRTQPPAAMSAMDGYAVRAEDVTALPARLACVGEAPAGSAYGGIVGPGEAVRIFTGAPVPEGADTIVIQEDTDRDGDVVIVREKTAKGAHVRPRGLDFEEGVVGLKAGRTLTARDIGLAAAMDNPWLQVRRKPRIALLATGDELVRPGEPVGPNQIISSNALAMAALITECGGEAIDLGIARDDEDSLRAMLGGARGADMLVTLGGASVGDHDLVQKVLGGEGLTLDFWRIAMRPGKPLMFGELNGTPVMGMPGNPVSSMVCGLIFLRPAIARLLGREEGGARTRPGKAVLGRDLPENDRRQDYLRASLAQREDGTLIATPFERQDSSMLSILAASDCLVLRAPFAPAARTGEEVEILPL